jgi:hypothetical protein
MSKTIGQLTAAGTLVGTEELELYQLSTTVTKTATTISAQASDNSYNDSGNGFVTAGFAVGDHIRVTGFTGNTDNNIHDAVVTAVTAAKLTIGGTDGDVIVDDAAGESVTITKWKSVRSTAQDVADLGASDSGALIQQVYSHTLDATSGTTVLPVDGTVPQNTEGTQVLSVTITPTSASNKLHVEVALAAQANSSSKAIAMALFQDSTASALAATQVFQSTANGNVNLILIYEKTAGTTSATTVKIRVGPNASATVTLDSGFGGSIPSSSISVSEIAP